MWRCLAKERAPPPGFGEEHRENHEATSRQEGTICGVASPRSEPRRLDVVLACDSAGVEGMIGIRERGRR